MRAACALPFVLRFVRTERTVSRTISECSVRTGGTAPALVLRFSKTDRIVGAAGSGLVVLQSWKTNVCFLSRILDAAVLDITSAHLRVAIADCHRNVLQQYFKEMMTELHALPELYWIYCLALACAA